MAADLKASIKAVDGQGKPIPSNGKTHDGATVTFHVLNNGTTPSQPCSASLAIYRAGNKILDRPSESVGAVGANGGSVKVAQPQVIKPDGPNVAYQVIMSVDTANLVNESNEGNNTAVLNFTANTPS